MVNEKDARPRKRLPLLRESIDAVRTAGSPVGEGRLPGAPPGAAGAPQGPAAPAAPVAAVHGVGDFDAGDVIAEIAAAPAFSRRDEYTRETALLRARRYTVFRLSPEAPDERAAARLLEVNWSDVRRAMPDALHLARNFVSVLLALTRIGVHGPWRSPSRARSLFTAGIALWLVEGLMVWTALAPALSALLWQLGPGQRVAAGAVVAGGAAYVGWLVRGTSVQLAGGATAFALLSLVAGFWTCFRPDGHVGFAGFAGWLNSWAIVAAASWVTLTAAEILVRMPQPGVGGNRWLHALSRIACLWLPMVLLVIIQPLVVASALLTMDVNARSRWGTAFSSAMPFSPIDGARAGSFIALAVVAFAVLGALLFKFVQLWGRNRAALVAAATGAVLVFLAYALDPALHAACPGSSVECSACVRMDWVALVGVLLLLASGMLMLFAQAQVASDPSGRRWYPAGAFARFWAAAALASVPILLIGTLVWLTDRGLGYAPSPGNTPDAAAVYIGATQYAMLLLPLATRPFAAFLDALGDVFFFVVREAALHTRSETQPRVWRAIRHLCESGEGEHVVLFTHSQGTVIASSALSRIAPELLRSKLRITLVTVGSPVTTLYRNFLGSEVGGAYGELCAAQPGRFAWINLYRPADYIGASVELPGVVNRLLLTPGDHVGYWSDAQLLRWIRAIARGEKPA